jgi:hypothetical protein
MTRYITPTGFAKQGGKPVEQLGSLRAVIEALPDGGVLVMATQDDFFEAGDILNPAGRGPEALHVITAAASSYDDTMLRFPAETPIGIAPGAYDRSMPQEYERAYAHLRRFKTVVWG